MATVTVQGRDENRRLIDVTLTTEADVAPPGPEVVSASGGEQTIRLLGPFRVNFNTANVATANGAKLADLDAGVLVLLVRVEVVTPWDAHADNARLKIGIGGAGFASGDWYMAREYLVGSNFAAPVDANTGPESGYVGGSESGGTVTLTGAVHRVVTAGALVAAVTDTAGATAGAADVYALIAEPAA
jgi:hypothetical protein